MGGQQGALQESPGHVAASCLRGEGTATEQQGVLIKRQCSGLKEESVRKYMSCVLPLLFVTERGGLVWVSVGQ